MKDKLTLTLREAFVYEQGKENVRQNARDFCALSFKAIHGGRYTVNGREILHAPGALCLVPAGVAYRRESEREDICMRFFSALPRVAETLCTDVRAAYEGDPAAKSEEEIMLAYPAFEAISIYRLAHELFTLGVPLIPRMMTEQAHKTTGVDIHPGATIGRYFFIDHATGVVVGETCTIGEHVKLYQGVTLGAKSFETDENGNPVKGIKRHPDIGNHVVIYANATILGGNTVVGDGCVIGASVWLTHSVAPGEKVYYTGGQ